ncbi:MAG: MFS transporter, partial [Frankiales bacterium]|nr:MFS transporter [Frankiales bacterium]
AGGTTVSVAGDAAALVALLLELRGAGVGWVSALLAAELIPVVLLAPLTGRVVDAVDNRRLLVAALGGQALLAAPLALTRTPWLVVTLFAVLSGLSAFVRPAVSALIPTLSGEAAATSAYAWVATGTGIGWIAGPALGGVLTAAFGLATALWADAATFLVLAVACSRLSQTRRVGRAPADVPRLGGARILWRDVVLRGSLLVTALAVSCAVVDNVAAPFRFVDQLGANASGYGAYLALWGAGALVGSQLPRRLPAAWMPAVLAAGNLLCGVGIVGIGLAPNLAAALVASSLGGIGNGLANVSMGALLAARVRPEERGRGFASAAALIQASTGAGTVAGAPLVAALGAGTTMIDAGAVSAVVSAAAVAWSLHQRPNFGAPSGHHPRGMSDSNAKVRGG